MQVICLEDAAFYNLVYKVFAYVLEKHSAKSDRWISGEEVKNVNSPEPRSFES